MVDDRATDHRQIHELTKHFQPQVQLQAMIIPFLLRNNSPDFSAHPPYIWTPPCRLLRSFCSLQLVQAFPGNDVRPPGNGGLTFDHILSRLQGKSRKAVKLMLSSAL